MWQTVPEALSWAALACNIELTKLQAYCRRYLTRHALEVVDHAQATDLSPTFLVDLLKGCFHVFAHAHKHCFDWNSIVCQQCRSSGCKLAKHHSMSEEEVCEMMRTGSLPPL